MTVPGRYLALDWGSTNRRVYLMDATGTLLASTTDALGISAMAPDGYPAALAVLRSVYGNLPVIAAGMVGSSRGWLEVPYVRAPAGLPDLAVGVVRVPEADAAIAPGVALDEPDGCDVMRGEEVQALGAARAGLVPDEALVCQPGTHSKWIEVSQGRITRFTSALTGEVFGLLRHHSLLSEVMDGPVADDFPFRDGIAAGAAAPHDLLHQLFSLRAAALLGRRSRDATAAYASGLLIGADVAARIKAGDVVHVLADARLGPLYVTAIQAQGGRAVAVDSHGAFTAGIHALWRSQHE